MSQLHLIECVPRFARSRVGHARKFRQFVETSREALNGCGASECRGGHSPLPPPRGSVSPPFPSPVVCADGSSNSAPLDPRCIAPYATFRILVIVRPPPQLLRSARRFAWDPSASGRRSLGDPSPRPPRHHPQRERERERATLFRSPAAYLPPTSFLSRFHFCVVEL